jgi:exodeoxyribonuclease III
MKIASWNVNSLKVRLHQVLTWLSETGPDVLALQETKLKDEDFPAAAFAEIGFTAVFSGQPTYNGVATLLRGAPGDVVTSLNGFEDEQRRVIGATIETPSGPVRVLNVYVPNGQSLDSEKYRYKLAWLTALHAELARELARNERCIVLGDFNIAPQDRDVHDPKLWAGKVLCSEPERAALDNILELGFEDTFRLFDQPDASYSWWDYRAAAFRRNRGLRIDLILASKALCRHCDAASIDVVPRRSERPSDHTPVYAVFSLE